MTDEARKTTIDDLRKRLFDTIDAVTNNKISLEQAKMVSDLSQVIVNTAKVEVDYLRSTGGGESGFLEGTIGAANLPPGIQGVTVHRLKG